MTVATERPFAAVARLVTAERTLEGDGFAVRRALPAAGLEAVGPFIFLDHFGPVTFAPGGARGAPTHPHRGFETLTYLLEGRGEHRDSLGNHSVIGAGEAQWMRAGSGILHDEGADGATRANGGRIEGVQFWINLPRGRKLSPPAYRAVARDEVPEFRVGDATVRLVAGALASETGLVETGPVATWAEPFLAHVRLPAGGAARLPVAATELGAYVTSGSVLVGDRAVNEGQLAVLDPGEATVLASVEGASLFLLGGAPLDAPIRRYGPFVMNTDDELAQAVRDYQAGRFGRIPPAAGAIAGPAR